MNSHDTILILNANSRLNVELTYSKVGAREVVKQEYSFQTNTDWPEHAQGEVLSLSEEIKALFRLHYHY